MLNYQQIIDLEKQYGCNSFYTCNPSQLQHNYDTFLSSLKKHYNNSAIGYSYKTNYLPLYCKYVNTWGGYAEVVSEMEYLLALKIGVSPYNIIYNGPYKTHESIFYALSHGSMLNIDSVYEVKIIEEFLKKNPNKLVKSGIRCNFELENHKISRFGFDVLQEDNLSNIIQLLESYPNFKIAGLHCHFPTVERTIDSYLFRLEKLVQISKQFLKNSTLEYIDIGGGFFGNMDEKLKNLFSCTIPSIRDYGEAIGKKMAEIFYKYPAPPQLIIEPGVALVGDTMCFYTKIIDIKTIRGKSIALCSGTFHNVKPNGDIKNLSIEIIQQPDNDNNKINTIDMDIAGYTCLEYDYLYKNFSGRISIGDYIGYKNMGSYSIVFKPPFINLSPPIFEEKNQSIIGVARKKENIEDVFNSYVI